MKPPKSRWNGEVSEEEGVLWWDEGYLVSFCCPLSAGLGDAISS